MKRFKKKGSGETAVYFTPAFCRYSRVIVPKVHFNEWAVVFVSSFLSSSDAPQLCPHVTQNSLFKNVFSYVMFHRDALQG